MSTAPSCLPGFETRLAFIDDAVRRLESQLLSRSRHAATGPDTRNESNHAENGHDEQRAHDESVSLDSMTGARPPWRLDQAEVIAAASCPCCGLMSQAITPAEVAVDTPTGPARAAFLFCGCRNGHTWPMLDVFGPDDLGVEALT